MKRRTKRRSQRWTKTLLQGATLVLGVVTLTASASAGKGDPPERPKQKPNTFVSHTNQDQVPIPPLWTHTNQDGAPLPGEPPAPGTGNERRDRHDVPPLSRKILDPGYTWNVPNRGWLDSTPPDSGLWSGGRDQLTPAQDPDVYGVRPGVLTLDRLTVLDPGRDAFMSFREVDRDEPQLRSLPGGASVFVDGLTEAFEMPRVPPSAPGTARPFIQSPVPGPGALSLIGLGALALIGRRRRG